MSVHPKLAGGSCVAEVPDHGAFGNSMDLIRHLGWIIFAVVPRKHDSPTALPPLRLHYT